MRSRFVLSLLLLTLGLLPTTSCNKSEPEPAAKSEAAKAEEEGEWCEGHGVPESHCTKCHPKLIDKFKAAGDWCEEHGYPMSVCPEHKLRKPAGAEAAPAQTGEGTPAVPAKPAEGAAAVPAKPGEEAAASTAPADTAAASGVPRRPAVASADDWCAEHAVPESMCTKCHPKLVEKYRSAGDFCEEHGYPESVCPKCNPLKPPAGAESGSLIEPGTKIRFKSPDTARAAGIEVVPAAETKLEVQVEAPAEIAFDGNRLAEIGASVPGTIREVLVDLGSVVKQGQPLFVVESARVGDLQAQLRSAQEQARTAEADFQRQEKLQKSNVASTSEVEASRKELAAARAELQGLESSMRIAGAAEKGTSGRYTVNAPIAGTIISRSAVLGMYVTEADPLATVADVSSMWALVHVAEWDASTLKPDLPVELRVDGLTDRVFVGKITWIASSVDPKTRTIEARAEIANPDGVLKANQYGRAVVRVSEPEQVVVVPRVAIQRLGEESIYFVQTGEGVYEPRVAKLGRSEDGLIQIMADLRGGEQVVTTGAFLLRTELSKDSIGAGCCEVEEPKKD